MECCAHIDGLLSDEAKLLKVRLSQGVSILRILHLVKTSSGAGWAMRVMQAFVEQGFDVHVAMPPGGKLISRYKELGITIHEQDYPLSPKHPLTVMRHGYALRKLVQRVQPDIVHSWFAQTTLYARVFLRDMKIPRVFQVPGPLHLKSKAYRYADVFSANKLDYWIGTSQCINDIYRSAGVKDESLALAYLGIDLDRYVIKEPGFLHDHYDIPKDRKIIGIVAYIYPPNKMLMSKRGVKGHEDLIDAVSILLKKRQDIHLVICGKVWGNETWYEEQIKAYGYEKCEGHITFTGFVDDVFDVFADLDVFVYPSHFENLGGVFESLLLKVPTVGAAVGGIPEAVIHNETGLLVDPNNHQEIADAIEKIIDNEELAQSFVEKGYAHIRKLMDIEEAIPRIASFYSKICPHPKSEQ